MKLLSAMSALFALFLWAETASAQLAPIGAHHATDEAAGGGGATASVPFEFPPARGGLPVPVSLVQTGGGAGAGGRGWDVPLSFLRKSTSLAHRRPSVTGNPPAAPEVLTVELLGESIRLIPQGNGEWFAQRGDLGLVAREAGNGWRVYDSSGTTFVFVPAPSHALLADTWLLDRIEAPGKAIVRLHYQTQVNDFSGQGSTTSLDLVRVTYNDVNGSPKHEVELVYNQAAPTALARTLFGERVLERRRTLAAVNVLARAAPGGALERIRSYHLGYEDDPDTRLPRLANVRVSGREGTDEEHEELPVVRYRYGTATTPHVAADGTPTVALDFRKMSSLQMPAGANGTQIASTFAAGDHFRSAQNLVDVTGDGRPELVFQKSNAGLLWVARNSVTAAGEPTLIDPGSTNGFPMPMDHMDEHTKDERVLDCHVATDCQGGGGDNPDACFNGECFGSQPEFDTFSDIVTDTWRLFADVNGDGRPDLVVADEAGDYTWVIYLNKPKANASEPWETEWVRTERSVWHIAQLLASRGHVLDSDSVPLTRKRTREDIDVDICWQYDTAWEEWRAVTSANALKQHEPWMNPCGYISNPVDPEGPPDFFFGVQRFEGQVTKTEWTLLDQNGDGGLDLLLNSNPVGTDVTTTAPPDFPPPSYEDSWSPGLRQYRTSNGDGNEVEAMSQISVIDPVPQSSVVTIARSACGLETWRRAVDQQLVCTPIADCDPSNEPPVMVCNPDPPFDCTEVDRDFRPACEDVPTNCAWELTLSDQMQSCGVRDINGDGLADRLSFGGMTGGVALLGNGRGFSSVAMPLPGPPIYHHASEECVESPGGSPASMVSDYRDITGDGIPDHVLASAADKRVRIGTGAGFGPLIPITGTFAIDAQRSACSGAWSATVGGLYDIDGDGFLDVVMRNNNKLDVHQLRGDSGPQAWSAGRVTAIENGYGGVSTFKYRSAKEDITTAHQVPFAEIIVTKTRMTATDADAATVTLTAAGDAHLAWDSIANSFVFPGYGRTVSMTVSGQGREASSPHAGVVTITDATGLVPPPSGSTDLGELFGRFLIAGQPRDITVLAGEFADAWTLLNVDVTSDYRRLGATHIDHDARAFGALGGFLNGDCLDIVDPYAASPNGVASLMNTCSVRGFAYPKETSSWRGTQAPPASENVTTRSTIQAVDDLGRPTLVYLAKDTRRGDDDVCIETHYAAPVPGALPRVLSAVASERVYSCNVDGARGVSLGARHTEYDGLPFGQIMDGFVTAEEAERRDAQTGDLLGTVRAFDAEYDSFGNVTAVYSVRDEDGAIRTTTTDYDAFQLAALFTKVEATGAMSLDATADVDPVTLDVRTVTDANGTQRGTRYDGFGRPVLTTLKAPGGDAMALSKTEYLGFAGGFAGGDALGRRIVSTGFSDGVFAEEAATAAGDVGTIHLDGFGRVRLETMALGADHQDVDVVVSAPTYDALGRVVFAPGPHLLGEDKTKVYGTTEHYNVDGSPSCSIRGKGPQPFTTATLDAKEIYPTCVSRAFVDGEQVLTIVEPDAALSGSPQHNVRRSSTVSAIGRVISRSTTRNGQRLEHATLAHDRLGNLVGLTRFRQPSASPPTEAVSWSWRYDSGGHLLEVREPGIAERFNIYSSWGELLAQVTPTTPELIVATSYDGLGRVTGRKELTGGVTDPETVMEYFYDDGATLHSSVDADVKTRGRLAYAQSPTGDVYLSYDDFGRVRSESYLDPDGNIYVQQVRYGNDGAAIELELRAPDTNHALESFSFDYDSARNLRGVTASFEGDTQVLYKAQRIDEFGRVEKAKLGHAKLVTKFAQNGRRLAQSVRLVAPGGERSIEVESYDPAGRERGRVESIDGDVTSTIHKYDGLGRLARSERIVDGAFTSQRTFTYDALGNLLDLNDWLGQDGARLQYPNLHDLDRLCFVGYGSSTFSPGQPCNVVHDPAGNIVHQPTRNGGHRDTTYLPSGAVSEMRNQDGTLALFRYGPFGNVQELDIQGGGTQEARRDRRYGAFEQRDDMTGPEPKAFVSRTINVGGVAASRRGPGGPWVFQLGEQRGNRFFFDDAGSMLQDVDYVGFGEATSRGEQPGSSTYTTTQWNDGDALTALGVSQLGARLYDPVIGRFLARDPLLVPRTAATTNPYAFAMNDPVNLADPTGLDPSGGSWGSQGTFSHCIGVECTGGSGGGISPWAALGGVAIAQAWWTDLSANAPGSIAPPVSATEMAKLTDAGNATPSTPRGRAVKWRFGKYAGNQQDSLDWDRLGDMYYEDYKGKRGEFIDRIASGSGDYYPPTARNVLLDTYKDHVGWLLPSGAIARGVSWGTRAIAGRFLSKLAFTADDYGGWVAAGLRNYADDVARQTAPRTPIAPLGRGSTVKATSVDRWLPRNLNEQLAVEAAMQNPTAGRVAAGDLTDGALKRWHHSEGWVKYQQTIDGGGRGGPISVHYNYNKLTHQVDDFKIVYRKPPLPVNEPSVPPIGGGRGKWPRRPLRPSRSRPSTTSSGREAGPRKRAHTHARARRALRIAGS